MNHKPLLIAECYFDTLIVEIVMRWQRKDFDHVKGTQLFNAMKQRNDSKQGITIGFFDKNKKLNEHEFMRKFKTDHENHGIQWLKNMEVPNQHVLYLKEGAEEWFLEASVSASVSPSSFNISDKITEFKKRTKNLSVRNDNDMYKFVKAVIRNNPPQIQTLREYIVEAFNLNQ